MKAIILSAGSKNEVSHIVGNIPKNLIPVTDGTTILELQLNTLHGCGIDDVSVVTGYRKDLFHIPGINYYINEQFSDTHVLYSLFCAEEELQEELIILYGDSVFDEECLERILEAKADISIGVFTGLEDYKKRNIKEIELVYFDGDNHVRTIGKRLTGDNEAFGQFTGIIKCTKKGIESIKNNYYYMKLYSPDYKKALISDLLNNIVKLGTNISCSLIQRGFIKINSEKDYEVLKQDIEKGKYLKGLGVKTDWSLRSKSYNNIQWVNNDEPLEVMLEMCYQDDQEIKLLDIGTGTGKVLRYFKNNKNNVIGYGIDISSEMMSSIDPTEGFHLSVCNAECLNEFGDNTFHIVTARMSMHHVANLEQAISEIYRVLKPGGQFIVCEGIPPTKETLEFYEEVFRYKEIRNVFLIDDLMNLLYDGGLKKINARAVTIPNMSMNNWLINGAIPYRNIDIISKLHYNCKKEIKQAYNMKFMEDDILMDWKFAIVSGYK